MQPLLLLPALVAVHGIHVAAAGTAPVPEAVLSDGTIDCFRQRIEEVKSGNATINGVNVGSWLYIEKAFSSSIFVNATSATNHPELEGFLGTQSYGKQALNDFWANFITEYDFSRMSAFGINAIRLPIGWWTIYNGSTPLPDLHNFTIGGSLDYLDLAMEWSLRYGIAVLIDLHLIDGQEYQDSGYVDYNKINCTLQSLQLLVDRYASHPALYGFALINEPAVPDYNALTYYYEQGYNVVRKGCPLCWVVISVFGYNGITGAPSLLSPAYSSNYSRTVMDFHLYWSTSSFSNSTVMIDYFENQFSPDYLDAYYNVNNGSLGKRFLVGEWSMSLNVPMVNANDPMAILNEQIISYRKASAGFFFWLWTYDGYQNHIDYTTGWSLQTYLRTAMLPRRNLTDFTDPCGRLQTGSTCRIVEKNPGQPGTSQDVVGRCQVCGTASSTSAPKYMGCYLDDWSKGNDFLVFVGRNLPLTLEYCSTACAGYKYFGVSYGNNCFCGDTFGRFGAANETFCNNRCASNSSQICGGNGYNSVYMRMDADVTCQPLLISDIVPSTSPLPPSASPYKSGAVARSVVGVDSVGFVFVVVAAMLSF